MSADSQTDPLQAKGRHRLTPKARCHRPDTPNERHPSCLRSALPVHLQERHINPQIGQKAAASHLENHLRNRRPKGVPSVSCTCQSATVTTQTILATGIAVGLGRRHISVIKPMFWACVNIEYQTESAPLTQCGGVTKLKPNVNVLGVKDVKVRSRTNLSQVSVSNRCRSSH